MTKKENICSFKGKLFKGKKKKRYYRYTEEEKAQKLKESIPYIRQGMTLRSIAAMVRVPYTTYYLWIVRLKEGGKAALEDRYIKLNIEMDNELNRAIEWLDKHGIKRGLTGFKTAKRRIMLKRTALTLYVRYRERVRKNNS